MHQRSAKVVLWLVTGLLLAAGTLLVGCRAAAGPTSTTLQSTSTSTSTSVATSTTSLSKVKWDFPHIVGPGHWNYDPYVKFFQEVEKRTNGGFVITPHPSGTLYNSFDTPKAIIEGKVQIAPVGASAVPDIFPEFGFYPMPFLIPGGTEDQETKALAPWVEKTYAKRGLKYYGQVIWPRQVIYTADKPIRTVEDFKGLKIRVTSKGEGDVLTRLGAASVTMPTTEVYLALKNKTIDGLVSSIGNVSLLKLNEVAKYINDWPFIAGYPSHVGINIKAWNALPEQYRQAFESAYRDLDVQGLINNGAAAAVDASTSVATQAGMGIVKPDAGEYAKAQNIARAAWVDWAKSQGGTDGIEAMEILYKAGVLNDAWWRTP